MKNSVGKNDWGNCRTDAFYKGNIDGRMEKQTRKLRKCVEKNIIKLLQDLEHGKMLGKFVGNLEQKV